MNDGIEAAKPVDRASNDVIAIAVVREIARCEAQAFEIVLASLTAKPRDRGILSKTLHNGAPERTVRAGNDHPHQYPLEQRI
jgi:hypothetical protein